MELARVVSRRYRKLRSGSQIGARAELLKLACDCGATVTKLGTVMALPLDARGSMTAEGLLPIVLRQALGVR